MNISSTNLPQIYRQSLVRRPVFSLVRLLVRPWPYRVAPAEGESFGAHICPIPCSTPSHAISCTPIPPWSSSKCRNTPSTNQLHVFAFQVGRSVWLNKDYCLNTSSSSKFFRQGGNGWNLFDFDNQSAAFFCVDTIKYYSIPSVPSHLEGVKTRPELRPCHAQRYTAAGSSRSLFQDFDQDTLWDGSNRSKDRAYLLLIMSY